MGFLGSIGKFVEVAALGPFAPSVIHAEVGLARSIGRGVIGALQGPHPAQAPIPQHDIAIQPQQPYTYGYLDQGNYADQYAAPPVFYGGMPSWDYSTQSPTYLTPQPVQVVQTMSPALSDYSIQDLALATQLLLL